jgi:hypothetical protein
MSDLHITHDQALTQARRSGMLNDPPRPFPIDRPAKGEAAPEINANLPDEVLEPVAFAEAKAKAENPPPVLERWQRPPGCRILKSNAPYSMTFGKIELGSDRAPGVCVPTGKLTASDMAAPLFVRKRANTHRAPFFEFSEADIVTLLGQETFVRALQRGVYEWATEIPRSCYTREELLEILIASLRASKAELEHNLETATSPSK